MVFRIVNQSYAIDNALSALNMNQLFLVTVTQIAVILGRVVDRTFSGQGKSLFCRQTVRLAEPDSHPPP